MNKLYLPSILLLLMAAACHDKSEQLYVASDKPYAVLYKMEKKSFYAADSIVRGSKVLVNQKKSKKNGESVYRLAKAPKGRNYYIDSGNLCADRAGVVQEKTLYSRSDVSIISDTLTSKISGLLRKGVQVDVVGYDRIDGNGIVNRYKVQSGRNGGYVYGKYLVKSKAQAEERYRSEVYDSLHLAAKDRFGGGKAVGCDFYPYEKPQFEDNPMPEACYSLYINFAPGNLSKIDDYIALAKKSRINTFVIDIKDNECPGFKSEAMRKYSPTNYARASKRGEGLYRRAVRRLHEEGFYVVGRITCFKDSYFVKDHPESAITEKATGEPFKHNNSYWPSAYDRKVWQFNVELAKEAVEKFGFNEINFDYVRFPDRMNRIADLVDYHNRYGESKVQAIQRFVMYACDEIHAKGAYVSVDVFGESANPGYTTAYGQYWPALSNVADVICGMPYPDHFPDGFYGISEPWNHPYELMNAWGQRVQGRQKATPNPAVVRTWIQAYPVMKHVDPDGLQYLAEDMEKEIRGLYSADLTGGYITWLASSNIERYEKQLPAFKTDYLKEYERSKASKR